MAGKRGNGEGSIFQRRDGKFVGCLSLGTTGDGRRNRSYVYGDTRQEADEKLTRLKARRLDGTLCGTKLKVGPYLDHWLHHTPVSEGTRRRYESVVRNHLRPAMGGSRLSKLTPVHIQGALSEIESPSTRRYAFTVLRRALNQAVRQQLLPRNPCDSVEVPRTQQKEIEPLSVAQVHDLLDTARDHRLYAMLAVAVRTGLRFGELAALRWQDMDFENQTLSVRHTLEEIGGKPRLKEPKSRKGKRSLYLSESACRALQEHRKRMMAEGLAWSEFVFLNTQGRFLRRSNFLTGVWRPLLRKAGLPPVRFHDLRHTCASLLLSEGVHLKVVQEMLGHSRSSTTLDTYSHVVPGLQREAAGKLDSVLGVA